LEACPRASLPTRCRTCRAEAWPLRLLLPQLGFSALWVSVCCPRIESPVRSTYHSQEVSTIDNDVIGDLRVSVDAAVTLDVRTLTGQQAAELAHSLARLRGRLDAPRLAALAEVQRSGVWALDGSRSPAAWLARTEQVAKVAAGADLKTARLLAEHLPASAQAALSGDLPVGHARVLARTCTRTRRMCDVLGDPERGERFRLQRFASAWAARVDPDAPTRPTVRSRRDPSSTWPRPATGSSPTGSSTRSPAKRCARRCGRRSECQQPPTPDRWGSDRPMR
jgi:hypothetical protein